MLPAQPGAADRSGAYCNALSRTGRATQIARKSAFKLLNYMLLYP
ncbi:hypothetical protein SAMN05444050_5813 [Afipia sp. GAS231]|nr:hypothetical protein SAMN05444050_5813 [Afipia sp. GAS231]